MPQCTLRALIGLCLRTKRPGPNIGQSCFCGADDALIVKSDCPIQIPKICIRCTSKVHDLHIKFIIIIIIIIIVNAIIIVIIIINAILIIDLLLLLL